MVFFITSPRDTKVLCCVAPRYTVLNITKSGLRDPRNDVVVAPHTNDSQGKLYFTCQNKPQTVPPNKQAVYSTYSYKNRHAAVHTSSQRI